MTTKHSSDTINEAIRWASDTLDWCQIPHVLIGDAMLQMKRDEQVDVDKIEFAIMRRYFNETTSKLFKTFFPEVELKKNMELDYLGVPVVFRIIDRDYKFFKNPDFVFYMADEYRIPNPYMDYVKIRHLIK